MYIKHMFHFGHLEMMNMYAVITCNERVRIDYKEVKVVQAVLDDAFNGEKFGLITNRINLYMVNPLAIKELFFCKNLLAGAIVGNTGLVEKSAKIHIKNVTGTPIEHFVDMDSAVKWIENAVR